MLKLENINITFNKNTANERKALQHIDLDVADGDFVTVIGSNGAGKSTLMNVISGSYEADTGKIFLDGKNITHLKEHQRARTIGRLFQDPLRGTAPNMTIEENLGLAVILHTPQSMELYCYTQAYYHCQDNFKNEHHKS